MLPPITVAQLTTRLTAAIANLETAETNWASLNAAQKDAAHLLAVRVTIATCYVWLGNLSKN